MSKYIKLSATSNYSCDRIMSSELDISHYITIDCMYQNKQGVSDALNLPPTEVGLTSYSEGDILIGNIRPYLKKIWHATQSGGCSADVLCIRSNINQDSKFIYYALSDDRFFEYMMKGVKGSKMPRGDKDQIMRYLIPNYSLNYQQKIASVLSSLDAKIELNNRIIRELEAMSKQLYDYWFVQFDFPNAEGKPYRSSGGKMVYNEKLKREIPEGWEVKKLDCLLTEFTKGITTKYVDSSSLVNLNQKANRGFMLDRSSFKYLDENIPVPESKFAKEKDILINSLGQGTLGRIHFFTSKEKNIIVDQHLFILRVSSNTSASYIYQLLSSKWGQKIIESRITGSTGMQMLNGSDLQKINLLSPTTQQVYLYEELCYSFFQKKSSLDLENVQLTTLRDWLLPMLMNGQVKVK